MAASNLDLFMEIGTPGTATTLSAPGYTIGNTSINIGSTANMPNATGVIISIDVAEVVNGEQVRVDGTYCEFAGTVASGTSVTNLSLKYGTPQDYAAGALTRVYVTYSSERENRLAQGISVGHKQDGTHKPFVNADLVSTTNIIDSAVTTAKIADASITNAKLSTATGEVGSAYQTYTATPGGFSGTPTTTAKWAKVGKTVFGYIDINGTSNATSFTFLLPVAPVNTIDLWGRVMNNAVVSLTPGLIELTAGSTTANVYRDGGALAWTASGNKRLYNFGFSYETA